MEKICNKTVAKYVKNMHYDTTPFLNYNPVEIDKTLNHMIIHIDNIFISIIYN